MKTLSIIALATLALSANTSFAADPSNGATPLTRAQVKKSVLDARANGELTYGEEPNYPYIRPKTTSKAFKRKPKALSSTAPSTTDAGSNKP